MIGQIPIVPVVKSDEILRICGDYKVTINKFLKSDKYPIPRIEDIFPSLSGGSTFSKIDIREAFSR